MISDYVISKLLDSALDKAKKLLARSKSSLRVRKTDVEEAITNHLREVNTWSSEVSFRELKRRTTYTAQWFAPFLAVSNQIEGAGIKRAP